MTIFIFGLRLFTALFLGACIGAERQWHQKSAGLRTNTLVSLGAAAFVLLSIRIGGDATGRIASYIVSGIGFLGAGVIMKDGTSVRGLNTAATIWCSASVGTLSATGMWQEAGILTAMIVFVHIAFRPLGHKIGHSFVAKSTNVSTDYLFTVKCREIVENHVRVLLIQYIGSEKDVLLHSLSSDDESDSDVVVISADIHALRNQDYLMEKLASRLTIEEKVIKVSWKITSTEDDS